MPATVTLRKDLARAIRGGHPWVFRDALDRPPRIADGTVIELRARDGRPLATGFWDASSPIAVRVLEPGPLGNVEAAVRERVRAALRRRLGRLDPARTNAFRWVHGEADRLPGLHVDLYDRTAVVRFDGAGAQAFYRTIGETLQERAGEVIHRRARAGRDIVVRENGLEFEVAPGLGGKGGLFLDQRENRQAVERRARGQAVLDLFGYTGAFSLYAARGGAKSTDTVDVSRPAIQAARRNFERNGLPIDRARFHAADAFDFLRSTAGGWDLVICDPPSFAPGQGALPDARRAYGRLHRLAAAATAKGGLLCAASCSSHFTRDDFLESVKAGARAAGRRFELEELRGAGFDHPVLRAFPEGDYLKFAIGRVR